MTKKLFETAGRINSKLAKPLDTEIKPVKTAVEVADRLMNKSAASKSTLTKKQINKKLDSAKDDYKRYNQILQDLKSQKQLLETKLTDIDSKFKAARSEMLNLTDYIRTLTLSGADSVVRYNDANEADDVGYIRDGAEYHIEVDSVGEVTCVPMKEHKKSKKNSSKKEEEECDELKEEDVEGLFEEGEKEDSDDADDVAVGDYYADKKAK